MQPACSQRGKLRPRAEAPESAWAALLGRNLPAESPIPQLLAWSQFISEGLTMAGHQ